MNWTQILKDGGIPEPPGREEIVTLLKWNVPLPPDWKERAKKRKR